MTNERKEKHRLLAKLAGIPWKFQCPKCYGSWFGSDTKKEDGEITVTKRYCHNENRCGCHWEGTDDECRRVPDYDDPDEMGAWVPVWKSIKERGLWNEFIAYWQSKGTFKWDYMKPKEVYDLLNDLPGQVKAAIKVLEGE